MLGLVISQDFGHLRKSTTWFTLERELKNIGNLLRRGEAKRKSYKTTGQVIGVNQVE